MKFTIIGAAVGVALAVAGCASRPEPSRGLQGEGPRVLLSADTLMFASFDANNDLRIDAAEQAAGIAREWTRADANGDGEITPLEMQTWMTTALGGADAPPYRLDFDRNVDNKITRAEFDQELAVRARDYDKDNDGVLTRAEFLREAPRAQMPMMQGGPRGGVRRRGGLTGD